MTYHWTGASLLRPLLPWLALLAILAFKLNRGWSAWWIWLPLACLVAGWNCLQLGLQDLRSSLPREVHDGLFEVARALALGIAALWLLAPCLVRRGRLSTFLRVLFVLAVFSGVSLVLTVGWVEGSEGTALKLQGLQALLALVLAAGVTGAGLTCRGHYRPIRICLGFCASLLVVCLLIVAPLGVFDLIASPGSGQLLAFFAFGLFIAAVGFVTLLPFLVLSFANAVFGQRLKALLHFERQATPMPP